MENLKTMLGIPAYTSMTDLDNEQIMDVLERTAQFRPYHQGISQSAPDLQENEELSPLFDCIEQHYNRYMELVGNPLHDFKIISMWANIYDGGGIRYHSHQNSFVSGVYYVKQSEPSTPTIFTSFWQEQIRLRDGFVPDTYIENPENSLMMFPSFTTHYADPCEDRVTIAFNIMPHKLGSESGLNNAVLFE